MPLVSAIIPTYNRTDILPRAIESVLEQTFADLELLVVDDGSSEDVAAVVDRYDDDRLRYLAHEENRGANVARNTGIEAAEGEYVAFLDSDDEWRPRKLEAQVARLESESEEWVAAYCDYEVTVPGVAGRIEELGARLLATDGGERREGGEELVAETLADELHTGAGSTLLVRTDVAREVGFDPELDRFQDPDFQIRVLKEGKLAHVPEPLVVRHYSGSPDADTVRRTDAEFLEKFAPDVSRYESRGYDIVATHRFLLAKYYLRDGRYLAGLRYLAGSTASARQVPGLLWFAGQGALERKRTLMTVAALAALAPIVGLLLARGDGTSAEADGS